MVYFRCIFDPQQFGRAKRAFGVDVHGLAFAAALIARKLARDAQRMAELRFACAKFAEELGNGPCLEPAGEELVEFGGACGDRD